MVGHGSNAPAPGGRAGPLLVSRQQPLPFRTRLSYLSAHIRHVMLTGAAACCAASRWRDFSPQCWAVGGAKFAGKGKPLIVHWNETWT